MAQEGPHPPSQTTQPWVSPTGVATPDWSISQHSKTWDADIMLRIVVTENTKMVTTVPS